jgi:hypothetical protein
MAERVLTLRELSRATLARQMLLARAAVPATEAVGRLVGLQAQQPVSPYVSLWTRLADFRRDDLARPIEDRRIVKATLMRATLHLCTADDYLSLRPTLAPVLTGASESIARLRRADLDIDRLLAAARPYIAEKPRTFAELSTMLAELDPDEDIGAMRYTVRTHLPLVQVPITTGWSYPGNPRFALAEEWLGRPVPEEGDLRMLVFRYLAAFGPATVTDIQTWSGLAKLREPVEKLKPELVTYRDEKRRELLDVPGGLLLDADTPAPVRFLPDFDNILLSHSDRTRVISEDHRSKVYLAGLRVAATYLVDGFVAGVWRIEKAKPAATLVIEPIDPLDEQTRAALIDEGERLLRFVEAGAKSYEVRFAE